MCCRSMGPIGSPMSQIGVQLTDSAYAVVNMRIMARVGAPVFAEIDKDIKRVVPCMHSVGAPLAPGSRMFRGRRTTRSTSFTFRRRARSGAMARAMAAMRCWAKSASRCASRQQHRARRRLDGGAHADPRRGVAGGREDLRRSGVPQRVRQDQLRDDDSAEGLRRLEDLVASATTSPGSSRTRTATCAR